MPLQATSGAASQDAFVGNGVAVVPTYIEDVFSCFLYTGTAASLTITNNIDLSTKGGLTWIKGRSGATGHRLTDTARGVTKSLASETTDAEATETTGLTAFGTTGFTIGADADYNTSAATYVSWTFRKQPKFFDIVTYTGTGVARTVAHNLGSVPACIIVKRTDTSAYNWYVYHRSTGNTKKLILNNTSGATSNVAFWNNTDPTSTVFTVGTNVNVNDSGGTYVAYIFAHDAGGFGLTGTDNVISCGTYVGNGLTAGPQVTLGWEPQWVLRKNADANSGGPSASGGGWSLVDNMRGLSQTSCPLLFANLSNAEDTSTVTTGYIIPNATGFVDTYTVPAENYIYIAIRRGPMKVPTTGTSVFTPIAKTGDGSTTTVTNVGFPTDLFMFKWRTLAYAWKQQDRLRGFVQQLSSTATSSEADSGTYTFGTVNNTGYTYGSNASTSGELNGSGVTSAVYAFRRAPSFFDEVCYTGDGSTTTKNHNLGVVPELMIVRPRNASAAWRTYTASLGPTWQLAINETSAAENINSWNSTAPTASVFSVSASLNTSTTTFVAYLFATCAGVSKVGSYTGTGTTKQIDCGFTAGARFVLIKRTDDVGDWYVWDTARGIIAGNDPYLLLNSTAAEVTNTDYIDTYSAGFEISSTAPAAINASAGTYIFLAIA
jgi:hypothetical protein